MNDSITWKHIVEKLNAFQTTHNEAEEPAASYGYRPTWIDADWAGLRQAMLEGAPWSVVEALKACLTWSDASLARFLRISEKTLQRNRLAEKTLSPDAAEKIIDLAQVLGEGLDTFGEGRRFLSWLTKPSPWFDNETPESFLFDQLGRRLVRDAIGRIEHGIFV